MTILTFIPSFPLFYTISPITMTIGQCATFDNEQASKLGYFAIELHVCK